MNSIKYLLFEKHVPLLMMQFTRVLVFLFKGKRLLTVILTISRILTVLTRMTRLYLIAAWPLSRDIQAMVFRRLLDYVTHNGGRFSLSIEGSEQARRQLLEIYAWKKRLILCSAHFPLNRVIHSTLHDCGIPGVSIKNQWVDDTPSGWFWGKGGRPATIENSHAVLIEAKDKLLAGYALTVFLDQHETLVSKKSRLLCQSRGQKYYFASNVFNFAAMTETPIVFFSSFLQNGKINVKIERPEIPCPKSKTDIETLMNHFAEFLKKEMTQRQKVKAIQAHQDGFNHQGISEEGVIFF